MALTIGIEGKGVIANCDALTDDTGGTGTGDWTEQGAGTMTLTPDVFLYGSTSIAGKYAAKDGLQQFDLGAGNELDFTPITGTEEGQMIYIWINMAAFAVLDDISLDGLFIRISSDSPGTTNYVDYVIAGGNGSSNGVSSNGWTGGWKLFVVDPTIVGTTVSGTQSTIISSVRTMGVYLNTWDSVRAESIFIDQLAVGSGLRITGTSTNGWEEVMLYCTDYTNRAWGMIQEKDGIYYLFGKMYIGDSTQTAITDFSDSGRILQFGTSQFYNSSGLWISTMALDACGIVIEDNATYETVFTDGVIVGTDNGRSGSTVLGNDDQNISIDLYGGNNAASESLLYGTSFKYLKGLLNSGDDTGHKFLGATFIACSQFDPVGAPIIRNCIFAETTDLDASLLWNENIDISNCSFIANTLGAAIEMPSSVGDPYAYDALTFSGNTNDVLNSSGSAISINKNNGSDPSSYEGSLVTFLGVSVTAQVTVKDIATGLVIVGARVLVWATDNTNYFYEASISITGATTTATVTHSSHGLVTGDNVIISGVIEDVYNGAYQITVTDVNTYTYITNETITISPATGVPLSTFAFINTDTDISGIASDTRSLVGNQPVSGRVRKSTGSPYYQQQTFSEIIDSENGKSINIQLISDE